MVTRANEFLAIGDAVNWYSSFGLPARTANVQKIKFKGAKPNDLLMVVKWELIDQCKILLSNGITIDGDKLEPFDENKAFQYPERERMN
jgi:hypothetical protein